MTEQTNAIDLGSDLDITMVATLRDTLLAAADGPLHLDGSRVQRVDAAGIQLLLSLARNRPVDGWHWRGGELPEPIRAAAVALGVGEHLDPAATTKPSNHPEE